MIKTLLTKYAYLLLIFSFFSCQQISGQGSSCSNPINLCGEAVAGNLNNLVINASQAQVFAEAINSTEAGCIVPSPVSTEYFIWYTFTIDSSTPNNSSFTFTLDSTNPNCATNITICSDIDFALYGPITSSYNCSNLNNPIRCSSAGISSPSFPLTGLRENTIETSGDSANGVSFVEDITVNPNEVYLLFVHYESSNVGSEYPFSFTTENPSAPIKGEPSTEQSCCDIIPAIESFSTSTCNDATVILDASNSFNVNGIANTNFEWTSNQTDVIFNGGNTSTPNISFANNFEGTVNITLTLTDTTIGSTCSETISVSLEVTECDESPCKCEDSFSCDGNSGNEQTVVDDFNNGNSDSYCFDLLPANFGTTGLETFCYTYEFQAGKTFAYASTTSTGCVLDNTYVVAENDCANPISSTINASNGFIELGEPILGNTYDICTVVDLSTCSPEEICTYVYNVCEDLTVSLNGNVPYCTVQDLSTLISLSSSGGGIITNVAYYNESGSIIPSGLYILDVVGETITVTATIGGCLTSTSVLIQPIQGVQLPQLVNTNITVCDSESTLIEAISPSATYNFYANFQDYENGNAPLVSNSSSYNPNTTSGNIDTIYVTNLQNSPLTICESAPVAVSVSVASNPTASITVSTCVGGSVDFVFNGTPNATITYVDNFGVPETVTLDATGFASITETGISNDLTYSLVSVESVNGCSALLTESATTICACFLTDYTVNAGIDEIICEGETFTLSGSIGADVTNFNNVVWTHNGEGVLSTNDFFDNNPTYTSGVGENTVTFTLTADDPDGSGLCTSVNDVMVLTISASPVASISTNGCDGGSATFVFAGTAGSTVFFEDEENNLDSIVLPANGIDSLVLTSFVDTTFSLLSIETASNCTAILTGDATANCPCSLNNYTVNAGIDEIICEGETFNLSGIIGTDVTNFNNVEWFHNGEGVLSTNDFFDNNPTYTSGVGENTVTFTLTADDPDGSGLCTSVNDVMVLTINPSPTASISVGACVGGNATFTFIGTPNATITYGDHFGVTETVTLDATGFASITETGITLDLTYTLVSVESVDGCSSYLSESATTYCACAIAATINFSNSFATMDSVAVCLGEGTFDLDAFGVTVIDSDGVSVLGGSWSVFNGGANSNLLGTDLSLLQAGLVELIYTTDSPLDPLCSPVSDTVKVEILPITAFYQDFDGDGLGNPNISIESCEVEVEGYVLNADDENDDIPNANTSISSIKFSITPNPAYDNLYINTEVNETYMVSLFSLDGKEVLRKTIQNNQSTINISKLSKGLYLLKIESNNTVYTEKIVKQ